jgi:hypothetical protein
MSKFKKLEQGIQDVIETRVKEDGTIVEISYPSIDFWVLDYIKNRLASAEDLEIRGIHPLSTK